MTLDAMKRALLDELFANGRAWTESVLDVSAVIPSGFTATADELTGYSRFAMQVFREFKAVSGDLAEAGGVLGAPVSYVREAGSALFVEHYLTGSPFSDWRLWFDRSLRSDLVGRFRSAYLSGKEAVQAGADMFDILAEQPAVQEEAAAIPTVTLPTAQTLESASSASVASNIGSFGQVGFEVSPREIFTLGELRRRRDAGYAEHKVVNGKPRLQFTGVGLWEITIRITLSRNWTDPEKRIEQLSDVQASGEHHPLAVGGRNFGRFVIVSYSESAKRFGRSGEIESAEIDLTLREYSEDGAGVVQVTRRRPPVAAPVRPKATVKRMTLSSYGGR